jgi:hypothetical protein
MRGFLAGVRCNLHILWRMLHADFRHNKISMTEHIGVITTHHYLVECSCGKIFFTDNSSDVAHIHTLLVVLREKLDQRRNPTDG